MSESPICTAPWRTCVRPVPEPPPWTEIVAPAQFFMYCLPAASINGCSAVEPAAVTLPFAQPAEPLPPAVVALPAGAADAAGVGLDPLPLLHAAMRIAAPARRTPRRL